MIDTSKMPVPMNRRFLLIADMPEFNVRHGIAYHVSDDLMSVVSGHSNRRLFVEDCVRRMLNADYGVVATELDSWNQDVVTRGLGTVYGVYATEFDTGDGVNQVWVAHTHDVDDSGKRFKHLPVAYLAREH